MQYHNKYFKILFLSFGALILVILGLTILGIIPKEVGVPIFIAGIGIQQLSRAYNLKKLEQNTDLGPPIIISIFFLFFALYLAFSVLRG